MAAKNPKTSRRERLLGRQRPSLSIPLPVEDVTQPSREVALAEEAWRIAHLDRGPDRDRLIEQARTALTAAMTALDGCYEQITVTALEPKDFEALIAEHPARKDKDEAWNDETFPRALFIACAGDDLSPAEWVEFLEGRCSQAERDALLLTAQQVNVRVPDGTVPKG